MSKVIMLVQRHGSTVLNEMNAYRSMYDPCLDPKGLEQAEKAAKFISENYEVAEVVASPLERAFNTAEIISEACGIKDIEQNRGLLPWQLGFLMGRDKDIYKDLLDYYVSNPEKAIPEGQSLEQFEDRTFEFFKPRLMWARENGIVLAVCHTSNICALSSAIKGERYVKAEIGEVVKPGGTVEITWDGNKYDIEVVQGKAETAEYGS